MTQLVHTWLVIAAVVAIILTLFVAIATVRQVRRSKQIDRDLRAALARRDSASEALKGTLDGTINALDNCIATAREAIEAVEQLPRDCEG